MNINNTKDLISGIIYSISYFTFLPVKLKHFEANNTFYKGVVFGLPISGLILGIITVVLYMILPMVAIYKAILVAILYLFLYGFIHLEAVADTIDGYFASLSNKDVHEIMKEPHIGSIGAIGTFCFVLLKILAISTLLYYDQYLAVILAFVLSRGSVIFALELEYHKESHFVNSLKESIQVPIAVKILFFPLVVLSKFILTKLKIHLGFLNGDTIGFSIELIEIILLNIGVLICL
jgi:adenosylcobinamide-GDP ribazoletransferase